MANTKYTNKTILTIQQAAGWHLVQKIHCIQKYFFILSYCKCEQRKKCKEVLEEKVKNTQTFCYIIYEVWQ